MGAPVILYLHGIEGHGQWFENTADALHQRGMTVYAPDRRGAGLNSRDRGHLSSYKLFVDDVNSLLKRICNQHVGHPIILWGNCWGAKAACLFAQDQEIKVKTTPPTVDENNGMDAPPPSGEIDAHPIAALVLSSPAIFPKVDYDLKTKMDIAANHVMGGRRALKKWPLPITTTMFTDNPIYLDYIEKDPLRLTELSSTFFVENFKLSLLAEKTAPNITKPLIIVQSGSDQIVDVAKLEKWYARVKAPDKTMRIFPDAYHCLDFDANWFREYTHLVSEWLLARTPVVS